MSARTLLFIFLSLGLLWDAIAEILEISQRKKPLPEAVSDIYSQERFQTFLDYQSFINKFYYPKTLIVFAVDVLIAFSGIFAWAERVCGGNEYLICLLTYAVYLAADLAISLPYSYIRTFVVDEKYGQNKMTHKEFFKDRAISEITDIATNAALFTVLVYICLHMEKWTNGFSVKVSSAVILCVCIAAAVFVFSVIISLVELFALRKQYKFTPMESGELRSKIEALTEGCKKKIAQIYIYDESKKSVEKNAFLLKIFWHREFCIADNFVNENSEAELLSVLAHEAGHLKHKKSVIEYLRLITIPAILAVFIYVVVNPEIMFSINAWVRESFGISRNNYYVLINIYLIIIKPLTILTDLLGNYISRKNEDEADLNSVKEGYGEELIQTFKSMSSDELIDVVKHPLLEIVEDDHPSMFHRIVAIRKHQNNI